MHTSQILAHQRRTGAHPRDAGPGAMVSTTSRWEHDHWLLDPPGSKMPSLTSMRWDTFPQALAPVFKELVWSLFVSRPAKRPLSLTQSGSIFYGMRHLARWMHERKRQSLGSVTPVFVDSYVSDLRKHLKQAAKDKKRDTDYDTASVNSYLLPLQHAFEQRRALETAGFQALPEEPFGGASAWSIAATIAPEVESFTPPLPDEVVLPVARAAHAFIKEPAEDLLRLQRRLLDLEADAANGRVGEKISLSALDKRRHKLITDAAAAAPASKPWLRTLAGEGLADADIESALHAYKRLLTDVIAACVVVLRFQTGIRHGEILTFAAGLRSDGTPRCVTREGSVSGAYELFFVEGVVEKGWDHPEDTRWLLAGRIKGSKSVPDALRALQVLNRVLAPWRAMTQADDAGWPLLLQFTTSGLPRTDEGIKPMTDVQLALVMKQFYERRVDWEALDTSNPVLAPYIEHKGHIIQSKQWRKTWANFVFRTNGKLLPAIAQQFQHFSTVLTQKAYIGKDAEQLGLVENAAIGRAIAFVGRALDDDDGVGGFMRKAVRGSAELRRLARGLTGDERSERLRTWFSERDAKIWPAAHGICFIGLSPTGSRCHAAAGTTDWSNQAPDFGLRNPRMCSGCECFGLDEEDLPFWADRYLTNKRIWGEAVRAGLEVHYSVAEERQKASAALLSSLGVDLAKLEKEFGNAKAGLA